MNIRKGFFRFTLVLSILIGIIIPLCNEWIFDKREVFVELPKGLENRPIQEQLNGIDKLFLHPPPFTVLNEREGNISVFRLPKIEQWNIKRQFKRKIISEASEKISKEWLTIADTFSFKVGWRELSLLAFVGFASTWLVYLFIRWVIIAFIIGAFKSKSQGRR